MAESWIEEDKKKVERAALSGNVNASFELAQRLMTGRDFERDPFAAVTECKFAARCGSVGAMNMLGYCYALGIGTYVDGARAYDLFRKAARKGSLVAWYNLHVCYRDGIGVEPSQVKADYWLLRAAKAGYRKAQDMCALRVLRAARTPEEAALAKRYLSLRKGR